jgi:ankyrin repeat protein
LSYAVKEKIYLVTEVEEDHYSREEKEVIHKLDLLLKSENINTQCQQGFTALHWAAMARDEKMIKKLLSLGADPSITNIYNRTPVDYYQYQINLSDFKDSFLDKETYQILLSECSCVSDQATMPEFSQLYIDDEAKTCALSFRNNESIDLAIFNLKNVSKNKSNSMVQLSQTQFGLFKPAIEQSKLNIHSVKQNGFF